MIAPTASERGQIERNVRIHDAIAQTYDAHHGEIFNDIEQRRLRGVLERARDAVHARATPLRALDFGCGSGNLTRHMLDLGLSVVAADVSKRFLEVVEHRFKGKSVSTLWLNGGGLAGIPDNSFEVVATYSVLHHVPDYMAAVSELGRVCRPGGVVLIDHEPTESYWSDADTFKAFQRAVRKPDWRKFLRPSNYIHKIWRLFDPRHTNEGDIHVWPDDHVEWPRIIELLEAHGFEVVLKEDYLLFRQGYRPEVYDRFVGRCADMHVMAFRKAARSEPTAA